jgi:wobble nucleotide-excising tRNase
MRALKKINKIKNCPSFVDFRPAPDTPQFAKYNLIYGWNGSGKTSFSRILRSFESGENYYAHPERSPAFEFQLSSGDSINQGNLNGFPNIRVFNKDFVSESIFGVDGPKPIFFLGKESKEEQEKIIAIENELKDLRKDRDLKKTLLERTETNKNRILSEKAKDIKNALTTTKVDKYRNYERPMLENALNGKSDELQSSDDSKLESDRLATLQKEIQQTAKPAIITLSVPDLDVSSDLEETREILQKTAVSQIIEALKSDDIVSKWVEHGLFIHKDKDLATCAFCNQVKSPSRFSYFECQINKDYKKKI